MSLCETWQQVHALVLHVCLPAPGEGEELVVSPAAFARAAEGFTPASIRNVALHTAGDRGWADVGGLEEVKVTLVQTLLWPSKVHILRSHPSPDPPRYTYYVVTLVQTLYTYYVATLVQTLYTYYVATLVQTLQGTHTT
jgi:hypothetical protein